MAAFLSVQIGIVPAALAGLRTEPTPSASVFHAEGLDPWDAPAVSHAFFENAEPLGFRQMMDYGMSLMLQDRFSEAVLVYNLAAKQGADAGDRAVATMWLGQALFDAASMVDISSKADERAGLFRRAGVAFNEASRIAPDCPAAIGMRHMSWKAANDRLELAAAEQDMRRAGLQFEGAEVVLSTGAILAIGFVGLKIVLVGTILLSELSQREKIDRLEGLFKIYAATLGYVARPAKLIR